MKRIKKGSYLLVILLIASIFLSGCNKPIAVEDESLSEVLYAYKTEYIGDNSKVLGIINNIEFINEYDFIEILSGEEPYGLNIYFKDDFKSLDLDRYDLEFGIIFSLIKNLDQINIYNNQKDLVFEIKRDEIDKELDLNTMDLYENQEKFNDLVMDYIGNRNIYIRVNSKTYKKEEEIVSDLVKKYIPKDVFNLGSMDILKNESNNNILLYLKNMENNEVSIKLEVKFNKDGEIIHYRFKNYSYELDDSNFEKINEKEARELASKFLKDVVDKETRLKNTPDAYKSLYEKGKHEVYSDETYIVVVDLENGYIEYFGLIE